MSRLRELADAARKHLKLVPEDRERMAAQDREGGNLETNGGQRRTGTKPARISTHKLF